MGNRWRGMKGGFGAHSRRGSRSLAFALAGVNHAIGVPPRTLLTATRSTPVTAA